MNDDDDGDDDDEPVLTDRQLVLAARLSEVGRLMQPEEALPDYDDPHPHYHHDHHIVIILSSY